MAASYRDIIGPVTVLTTFIIKPEFADRIAQYMSEDIANQLRLAREGKMPGLISIEGVRFGNNFASWERYTDGDAVERVVPTRFKIFKDTPHAEGFIGPPNIQFFGTNSLPPSNK